MDEIFKLDISEDTIKMMIEMCPSILEIDNEDVIKKEKLLLSVGCSFNQIRNIISSNPLYLDNMIKQDLELFRFLIDNGFENINDLLEANPYILNKEVYEIEQYINKNININKTKCDIIELLNSDPLLFNEI